MTPEDFFFFFFLLFRLRNISLRVYSTKKKHKMRRVKKKVMDHFIHLRCVCVCEIIFVVVLFFLSWMEEHLVLQVRMKHYKQVGSTFVNILIYNTLIIFLFSHYEKARKKEENNKRRIAHTFLP